MSYDVTVLTDYDVKSAIVKYALDKKGYIIRPDDVKRIGDSYTYPAPHNLRHLASLPGEKFEAGTYVPPLKVVVVLEVFAHRRDDITFEEITKKSEHWAYWDGSDWRFNGTDEPVLDRKSVMNGTRSLGYWWVSE